MKKYGLRISGAGGIGVFEVGRSATTFPIYSCFAEAIGATVVSGRITNRAALIRKYEPGVLSFAWAYYVNLKKEIPRSDPIVPMLERNSGAALNLFFDWLQARMQQ